MAGIIHKGSTEHKTHLAGLAKDAKSDDKSASTAAAANLKQHEPPKADEKKDK